MICLLLVGLAIVVGPNLGCKQPPSTTANKVADTSMKDALQPRLEKLSIEHPELKPGVDDVLQHWADREPRQTFDQTTLLLQTWSKDHPDDAEDVTALLRNWQRRLDNFGQ